MHKSGLCTRHYGMRICTDLTNSKTVTSKHCLLYSCSYVTPTSQYSQDMIVLLLHQTKHVHYSRSASDVHGVVIFRLSGRVRQSVLTVREF